MAKDKKGEQITDMEVDFAQWFTDVCTKAKSTSISVICSTFLSLAMILSSSQLANFVTLYYSTIVKHLHRMAYPFLLKIIIQEALMTEVTLRLDSAAALLYRRIAEAQGISLEQVLSDALFKLAGELSLQALQADK